MNYNPYWLTWVYHEWQVEGMCTMMRDYHIEHADCNTLLPFVCERGEFFLYLLYVYNRVNYRFCYSY